jgi:hypothetical protein
MKSKHKNLTRITQLFLCIYILFLYQMPLSAQKKPQLMSIFEQLNMDDPWVVKESAIVKFWTGVLSHVLWEDETQFHAETTILVSVPQSDKMYQDLASINALNNTSALIYDPQTQRIFRHCSLTKNHDQQHLTALFVHAIKLQISESYHQGVTLQEMFGGEVAVSPHPIKGIRKDAHPLVSTLTEAYIPASGSGSQWGSSDFNRLKPDQRSVQTNTSATGLTAEFPYHGNTPAMQQIMKEKPVVTALFRAATKEQNILFANGLKIVLTLPDHIENPKLANVLNLEEAMSESKCSLLGGWAQSDGDLFFVTFLPNLAYKNGLLDDLYDIAYRRANWVKERIQNLPTASGENKMPDNVEELFRRFTFEGEGEGGIAKNWQPVADDFYTKVDLEPLLMWGIFNPIGPTVSTLALASLEGMKTKLLYFRMLNPFSHENLIVGGLSPDLPMDRLIEFIHQLFKINSDGNYQINDSLPTFIMPMKPEWRHHSYMIFGHVVLNGREDLTRLCDVYEDYMGKPWERTKVQMSGQVSTLGTEDIDEVDNDAFIRWSQIMMNEAHWGPEFLNLQKAWEGAIGFQESMGTLQIHEDLMRFDDFNAYLKHIGLDVFKE